MSMGMGRSEDNAMMHICQGWGKKTSAGRIAVLRMEWNTMYGHPMPGFSVGTFDSSRKLGSQTMLQVRRVGSWAVAGTGAFRTVVLHWPSNVRLDGLSEHEIRGAEVTKSYGKKK